MKLKQTMICYFLKSANILITVDDYDLYKNGSRIVNDHVYYSKVHKVIICIYFINRTLNI